MKNKIGWCNATWNPVWGCRNKCSYCYARIFAKRFGSIRFIEEWKYRTEHNIDSAYFKLKHSLDLIEFKPTFLYSQYNKKLPIKAQRIFVGSMSEIAHWEDEWLEKVLEKVKLYPQHIFQFLTKYPQIYGEWVWPKNCWLGVTITENPKDGESGRWGYYEYKQNNKGNLKFVCYEPLLMQMLLIYYLNLEDIDWVIIGAETGNRKGKIIPKKEWIEDIVNYCRDNNIPLYLKDSLKDVYPEEIKEFPKIN